MHLSPSEFVGHFLKGAPLHTLLLIDPIDEPLVHHQYLGLATNLGMNADWKHELFVLSLTELKLLLPKSFDLVRVNEAGRSLSTDGLKCRPIVNVPIGRDLHDRGRPQY